MKIMIKSNPKEQESSKRFYVTKNDKIVQAHLTLQEAETLRKKIKENMKSKSK